MPPSLPELSEKESISMGLTLLFSGGGLICHLVYLSSLEYESISMNLKLPLLGGLELPLDLPSGLPELSEYESISMNLKLPFSREVDLPLDLP